jgi:hypothetical protein
MTTVHQNELVADYLRRLERAAAPLTRSRRAELVAEIREHIDDALLEAGAADEVAVRNVLERLGPPEEIAAAAGPAAVAPTGHAGKLEIAALVALAVPFVGWLVGIPLVLLSQAWASRDKAIAGFLVFLPLLLGVPLVLWGADGSGDVPVGTPEEPAGGGLGPLEVGILITGFLGGLVASVYLALRLRRSGQTRALEA